MPMQLEVISGPDKGRRFALMEGAHFLLGRSRRTQCQLADRKVSRVHCEIDMDGEKALLIDLESQSGTYVNGKRIKEQALERGDVVQIGETQIRYLSKDDD